MNQKYARYGAASGIVFVVLVIVAFGISPEPPDADAPAAEVSQHFIDEQDGIRVTAAIFTAALFFFIWFLGSLSSALRAAIGSPRLPTVAFGGGLLGAAFI